MSDTAMTAGTATLTINSQALGPLEVDPAEAIEFVEPVAGFPDCSRYVIIPHVRPDGTEDNAIAWLQGIEAPYHAFVITDPWSVAPDYAPEISDADAAELGLTSFEDARLFGILTVPADPHRITINLRAPIVVNAASRQGKQAVLLNDEYHTRHPLAG